jgi:hypothetical protein
MTQRTLLLAMSTLAAASASAQVPDLVNAFDAGGRALGMGGATSVTGSDTLSNYHNPAGLAFVDRTTMGMAFRNFPQTKTVVTGDIGPGGTRRLDTKEESGPTGLGHVGIAIPVRSGVVGLSLTSGGQMRDQRIAGPGLVEGGLSASNYREFTKIDTDFVNLNYSTSARDGSFSWGVGLVYAINRQINEKWAPSGLTNFDVQANGLGGQAGILVTPKENPDLTFGLSYRTPIKLKKSGMGLIYSEIPGRVEAGVAIRRNGITGSANDFMVLGLDISHYFAGKQSLQVDRDAQTVVGAGIEYNFFRGAYRIPIRLGYSAVPGGGEGFGRRNSFTYGLGLRPTNGDWGLDLNFGTPGKGGKDFGLSFQYKLK